MNKDPVVRDLTAYINRSAGQHQRRISEDTESAARLLRLPVRDTMTADRLNLHRPVVDGQTGLIVGRINTKTMAVDDGVSVGGCCTHECNEGRDCQQRIEFAGEEPYSVLSIVLSAAVIGALCLLVWHISPELRGLVSIIKH